MQGCISEELKNALFGKPKVVADFCDGRAAFKVFHDCVGLQAAVFEGGHAARFEGVYLKQGKGGRVDGRGLRGE